MRVDSLAYIQDAFEKIYQSLRKIKFVVFHLQSDRQYILEPHHFICSEDVVVAAKLVDFFANVFVVVTVEETIAAEEIDGELQELNNM